ncbi:MAG: serine/threonine protein kinase, partial [Proteobacteria bacterium]|nr:serine/threonine protein kinase [Pseudomonadota bacterium]
MKSNIYYLLAQSLSLIFYIITLFIYKRARKEYVGGKIAAAIKLIMFFLVIRLLSDFADYFFTLIPFLGEDSILIFKIVFRLVAMCVLFFGGLRFFISKPAAGPGYSSPSIKDIAVDSGRHQVAPAEHRVDSTVVLQDAPKAKPFLGRYEILEQIGIGAMGIVYKGRDPKLQRIMAIKTIRFTEEYDEEKVKIIKEQFYREAEVVAKLSHPNIVTVYDVGEDLDLSYLAMEYLEGESLEIYTTPDNLLPIEKCIDVISQVCDALAYAHDHGIVHRDIKPANIMLLKNGLVKVTDFGVARAVAGSKTRTGTIKGTPYYMSPEQTKGLKVSGVSDIFSLGVVLYQLLTGRLPFFGDNLSAIMYQVNSVDPEPPTIFNPNINQDLLTILDQSLAKNLEKRYQTAKQMGDHLKLLSRKSGTNSHVEKESGLPFDGFAMKQVTGKAYDAARSGFEPQQEDDLDFSDLEFILETGDKTEDKAGADLHDLTELPEVDLFSDPAVSEAEETPEIEPGFSDLEQLPDTITLEMSYSDEPVTKSGLSKPAKRIIFYGCLILTVAGSGYYFYWKSSRVHISIVKKRRDLPVDLNNIKAYIEQQKQKRQE